MEKIIVYRGSYKGVNWEIDFIERSYAKWWTYYVFLKKDRMIANEFKLFNCPVKTYKLGNRKRKSYDYYKLPGCFEFHGGCTYYEKHRDDTLGHFVIQIGCDYNHAWDEDEAQDYCFEDIISDVNKSIDKFLTQFKYKRWCGNCGELFDEQDGKVFSPDDNDYSFKCNKCIEKNNLKNQIK